MLFNIIVSFSLLIISKCLDSLDLSVSSSSTKQIQIGSIDSNIIVIFNNKKTALYNVNTNTITYINETLGTNNYLNFAIGGTIGNTQYIFSGSDLVSISGNSVVKANPSPNLASSSTFCFPYKDNNNITQGFFLLEGFTLSLYKFDSMRVSSDSFPLSGSVNGLGAIYSISNNQVYEIIHIGSILYSVIFDVNDNSISYSRYYLQSNNPFSNNQYTTEYESIIANSTTFIICGIYYSYCSYCSPQYYYYIKCALVDYGVNYADVKNSADICSNRLIPSYFKVAILSETDESVRKCPSSHPFYAQYPGYTQCLEDCPSNGLYTYKAQCVSTCPEGTSPVQTDCIDSTLNANSHSISSSIESSANKTEMDSYISSSLLTLLTISKTIRGPDYSLDIYTTDDDIPFTSSNTSSIDLSSCESELKAKNIINQNSHLIIAKYDLDTNTSYTNSVEFKIFDSTGKEIDKSYCADTNISVSYPLYTNRGSINFTFSEQMQNDSIDIFNPQDEFFNDMLSLLL